MTFAFFSCKNEKEIIQEVAYNYAFAMGNYLVEDAEQYATPETKETTLEKAKYLVKAVGPEYISKDTPANLEITSLDITSDTTAVACYHKTTPLKDFTGEMHLVKRNGTWLVHDPLIVTKQKKQDTLKNKIFPKHLFDSIKTANEKNTKKQ